MREGRSRHAMVTVNKTRNIFEHTFLQTSVDYLLHAVWYHLVLCSLPHLGRNQVLLWTWSVSATLSGCLAVFGTRLVLVSIVGNLSTDACPLAHHIDFLSHNVQLRLLLLIPDGCYLVFWILRCFFTCSSSFLFLLFLFLDGGACLHTEPDTILSPAYPMILCSRDCYSTTVLCACLTPGPVSLGIFLVTTKAKQYTYFFLKYKEYKPQRIFSDWNDTDVLGNYQPWVIWGLSFLEVEIKLLRKFSNVKQRY